MSCTVEQLQDFLSTLDHLDTIVVDGDCLRVIRQPFTIYEVGTTLEVDHEEQRG